MPQTPQQRFSNQRYAKQEAKKHGQPASAVAKKNAAKPPVSRFWLWMFAFLVGGGMLLEVFSLFFGR
ncbi:uncharacterized protein V1510DRAFT_418679 [Dipodascopsis tothii]|uniref:uncharacterized protein n=1 Tax=Dipodascopsis tothii TaxID=44089 RepID=UPI0034CD8CAE